MILKNKVFQLFLAVCLGIFVTPYLNIKTISIFFTISQFLKDFLMLVLPFLIFFCLSSVLIQFKSAAPVLILGTIFLVIVSNAATVLTSYGVGYFTLPYICAKESLKISCTTSDIECLWRVPISLGIKNEWALISGVLIGICVACFKEREKILNVLDSGKKMTTLILNKCFITFLPLYIFGFVIKLVHEGAFMMLIGAYGRIFLVSVVLILSYLLFMYFLAANFSIKKTFVYIKNMLPAGITGFSTMSSMAALPITMQATEDNLDDKNYAEYIVPATANIHMVGDGLNISLTALSLVLMTCHPYPDFYAYFLFMINYCIYKFTAVGVPGGGVLVILPIAQQYLSLSPELTSLLATIYFLQDSFLTSANVMANGAFAILSHRFFKSLKIL